jgi:hypothetical protein
MKFVPAAVSLDLPSWLARPYALTSDARDIYLSCE